MNRTPTTGKILLVGDGYDMTVLSTLLCEKGGAGVGSLELTENLEVALQAVCGGRVSRVVIWTHSYPHLPGNLMAFIGRAGSSMEKVEIALVMNEKCRMENTHRQVMEACGVEILTLPQTEGPGALTQGLGKLRIFSTANVL